MRKACYILVLLTLSAISSLAQKKLIVEPSRDTIRRAPDWQQKALAGHRELGLLYLRTDTTTDEFYRYSDHQFIVEAWRKGAVFEGRIVSFVRKHVSYEGPDTKKGKRYHKTFELPADTAKALFQQFKRLDSVPSVETANAGRIWVHASHHTLQRSTPRYYESRNYWALDTLSFEEPRLKLVSHFIDALYSDLSLSAKYQAMLDTLPRGIYTNGFYQFGAGKPRKKHRTKR